MPIIYSTATNDISFAVYEEKKESKCKASVEVGRIKKAILINGMITNETRSHRNKPRATEVEADDFKLLKANKRFIKMAERGFMHEKIPAEVKKDKSSQISANEMAKKTKAKVVVPSEEDEE